MFGPHVFLHIGDVHLQHGSPRNADRLASLDQIIEATDAEGTSLAAVLIPGDLFHQKSTPEDRNALAERLRRFADRAPVVLVRGNHDAPGDLDIFASLRATYPIHVVTRPHVLIIDLPTGHKAAIACLPYPEKSMLVSAGVVPGAMSSTGEDLFDPIFMTFAAQLELARTKCYVPLFLGHVNVRGARTNAGQPQIGLELEITQAHLDRLGAAVYCGLSHIHLAQELGRGVYAGSIAAMDYSESDPKSFVRLVVQPDTYGAWQGTWSREPLRVPPMHHVTGRLTRDGFAFDDEADFDRDWTGTDTRVRYRFAASERDVLQPRIIHEIFAGALRLKVEGIAELDREVRAPEVAKAVTLADKLAAMAKVEQLGTGMADKLARLEATADLDMLAASVAEDLRVLEQLAPAAETATVAA